MTVSVVDEEENKEVPIISSVYLSGTKKATDANVDGDEFANKAEHIKTFDGLASTTKRAITTKIRKASNTLEKYQQNIDGDAGTKQINEKTFATGYDAFGVVQPPYNLDYLARLYEACPPHKSAVNAKVANIVGLGYAFTENATSKRNLEKVADDDDKTKKVRNNLNIHRDGLYDQLESFNEEDTFTEILIKVWRDYETTGNGYLEVGRKRDGTIGYLGHVPSQTIRIRRARDGFVQISGSKVQFFSAFGHADEKNPIGNDKPNELLHLKKYSPVSSYYGVSDIIAASQAVAGNKMAQDYNLDYFDNKAVPRHAIILKGAEFNSKASMDIFKFFETSLKGQNHRTLVIPLPASTADNPVDLKIQAIEAGIQDSSFNNYRKANISDILMSHRVPITKISVSEAASLAIAKDADKTFKEEVCDPEQNILEKKLNRIIKELTDAFDISLNQMTLTDENTQSQIDERRRKTGIETANEQRAKRGDTAVDGGDSIFDMNAKSASVSASGNPTGTRQRDSVRSAGATDSAGSARNPKGEGRTTQ